MKLLAVVAGFAALVLAAAAAFAPATLLDARLDTATQGQLRLANAAGTLWNGHGMVTNPERTWSFPISWTIAPQEFARGNFVVTLRDTGKGDISRGDVAWRDGTLAAKDVAFSVPSAVIGGANASTNALAFGGTLAFDAPQVSWSGNGGDGAAAIRWSGARIASDAGAISLGTVTVNGTPRSGRLQGRVENRGGDVRIDGEFTMSNAGVEVNATLATLPSTPPAVVRALGALGTPDSNGSVRVQWRSGSR